MIKVLCDHDNSIKHRTTDVNLIRYHTCDWARSTYVKLRCYYCIRTGIIRGKKLDCFQGLNYFLLKYILKEAVFQSVV